MKFNPVTPVTPGPLFCLKCGRRLYPCRELVWADLKGPAFAAYYCNECKIAMDDIQATNNP
jgi:hypothetical protein